jgi:Leucine-rich repeat (LRR) protein
MTTLYLSTNQLTGTPPFAHLTWCGSTSLPLALKTSSFALAGSIPTEFGKLINMKILYLDHNKLTGTPSLLILHGVVVQVYHLL